MRSVSHIEGHISNIRLVRKLIYRMQNNCRNQSNFKIRFLSEAGSYDVTAPNDKDSKYNRCSFCCLNKKKTPITLSLSIDIRVNSLSGTFVMKTHRRVIRKYMESQKKKIGLGLRLQYEPICFRITPLSVYITNNV